MNIEILLEALVSDFFNHQTLWVAQQLIGARLCRRTQQGILMDTIVETEAYLGQEDLASHARFGKTKRNAPMYAAGGIWYVYLCYGMHCMLNVVTEAEGHPAAVLIRSLKTHSGPGRLTKAFSITQTFNGLPCAPQTDLWLLPATEKLPFVTTPRIGINYAGSIWANKPYRFIAKGF